jgi:hypothetical protein
MKNILSAWLIIFSITVHAQPDKPVTNAELKTLVGNWSGPMVATGFADGKNQVTYSTALTVVDMQDSLMFSFTCTDPGGKQQIERYPLRMFDNGSKLNFDSTQFDVAEIRRRGPRLFIYAERSGYDVNRPADYQIEFIIGMGILNITKGVRYGDMVNFSTRKRLTLTKK